MVKTEIFQVKPPTPVPQCYGFLARMEIQRIMYSALLLIWSHMIGAQRWGDLRHRPAGI
jgi:hypothetical protein